MYSSTCYPPVKPPQKHAYAGETTRQYVKYVPVGFADTHSLAIGYLFWLVGFTGAHRFYYGRPITGTIWLFTFGLLGIGWLVDVVLIPSMDREADRKYVPGKVDYSLAWVLFVFLGVLGVHRFYQMKIFTGLIYFLTGGLFFIGIIYDAFTLNDQVSDCNSRSESTYAW